MALERFEVASRAARERSVVVLAKGAPTCVATPDGGTFVNSSGHAGLATAGSGDVLTGIVGALLAQRCTAVDAAVLGTYLHGHAAESVATGGRERSVIASDLLGGLGAAYEFLRSDPRNAGNH
jgi:NAD(P)H-hydrate epimerase